MPALKLARKRGGNCIAVIMGEGADGAAAEIAKYGVSKVIALEDPRLRTSSRRCGGAGSGCD